MGRQQGIQIGAAAIGAVMFLGLGWPLGLYLLVGTAIWYVATRKGGSTAEKASVDGAGLPVIEWTDEYRVPLMLAGQRIEAIRRRCCIMYDEKQVPHFVVESVSDRSGKFLPFGGIIATDALRGAKKALGMEEIGLKSERQACPWVALQSFVLTNGNEKYGLRAERPRTMLFADMGPEWGEALVCLSAETPAEVADLHRRLTREFIEGRSAHLERLAAAARRARSDAAEERKKVI